MQQVTTKKFAEMCGVSDANIRGMIARGSLVATKDSQGNNLLDIEDAKNREYLDAKRSVAQDSAQDFSEVAQSGSQLNSETFERITQHIAELAIKAGKAEQLEANIMEKKLDAKEWQDRYFELQSANDRLRNDNVILSNENKEIKSQRENDQNEINALNKQVQELLNQKELIEKELESERKKPFWKRNVL